MAENRLKHKKKMKGLIDLYETECSSHLSRMLRSMYKLMYCRDKEDDESEDVIYEYINLVYPPDSKPPLRESTNKINIFDFKSLNRSGFLIKSIV